MRGRPGEGEVGEREEMKSSQSLVGQILVNRKRGENGFEYRKRVWLRGWAKCVGSIGFM